MSEEAAAHWLTVAEASRLLGVNESTLRRWADEGRVRVYRTPGGHRRFAEDELRTLLTEGDAGAAASRSVADLTLNRIRRRLQARQATGAPWNQQMDEALRPRMRALGRRLVGLVDDHLAGRIRPARLLEEAAALGDEYGQELASAKLPLSSAIEAFAFFRRSFDDAISRLATGHGLSAEGTAEAHDHLAEVADGVLIAIIKSYERHQAANGLWKL